MHLWNIYETSSIAKETVIKEDEYCQTFAVPRYIVLLSFSVPVAALLLIASHHCSLSPFYIFFAVHPQRRTSVDYHLVAVLVNIY